MVELQLLFTAALNATPAVALPNVCANLGRNAFSASRPDYIASIPNLSQAPEL